MAELTAIRLLQFFKDNYHYDYIDNTSGDDITDINNLKVSDMNLIIEFLLDHIDENEE